MRKHITNMITGALARQAVLRETVPPPARFIFQPRTEADALSVSVDTERLEVSGADMRLKINIEPVPVTIEVQEPPNEYNVYQAAMESGCNYTEAAKCVEAVMNGEYEIL
jgi:hypothetical protein